MERKNFKMLKFLSVSLCLLLLCSIAMCVGFCIIRTDNVEKVFAEELISQVNAYETNEENERLLTVTDRHIYLNMGKELNISRVKQLKDFSNNVYTLFELTPIGYAIYHNESARYVEYAENSKSPYEKIESMEMFYAGPMQYYYKDSFGNVQHTLKYDLQLSEQEIESFSIQNDDVNMQLNLEKSENILNFIDGKTNTFPAKDIETTEIKTKSSNADIAMTDFFPRLLYSHDIGYRGGGVCGYIALNLVLGYNALAFDSGLVPSKWMDKTNKRMFGAKLTNILIECDGQDPSQENIRGTNATNMMHAVKNYFEKTEVRNAEDWKYSWRIVDIDAKKAVEAGHPVIIFGKLKSPQNNSKINHAVVAYGATKQGLTGVRYRVHFGWAGYASVYLDSPLAGSDFWMEVVS